MKTLAFLNLEHRDKDADGKPLDDYKYDTDEMIVELDDETQDAVGETHRGVFRFTNLNEKELSPFVSLDRLMRPQFRNDHYQVG